MSAPSDGPLQAVWSAVARGVTTRVELRRSLDFPDDVIDAALDHLVRSGQVAIQPLAVGLPTGNCGGCPLATRKVCQSLPVSTGTCQPAVSSSATAAARTKAAGSPPDLPTASPTR